MTTFASLPTEIHEYVTLVSSHAYFEELVPRRAGCTNNAFFVPNEETHVNPRVERRSVTAPMPEELRLVYERYPDDTEFTDHFGWSFLSEREILKRRAVMVEAKQNRIVDLGLSYAGMGHVYILSYDPESKCVFTSLDGGANGYDRRHNHNARIRLDVETAYKTSFASWWKQKKCE